MFGLFKKNQTADTIFVNGNIYTQDADMPWAEAVACNEGEIIYVGNSADAESFMSEDTVAVDLEGKYMLPGLINTHSHPALRIFKDTYIQVPEHYHIDDVLGMMSDYVFNNPDEEVYFAYGMAADLLIDLTREEASAKLDEICADKPMLILSAAENDLWVNTEALTEAQTAAQEDGLLQITISYFLQAVAPFDYEELQERTLKLISEYCDRGFTGIFNAGCPEFMNSIYHDFLIEMCQQDMVKQRNFESLKVTEKIKPDRAANRLMQKKTAFLELDDYVHCNALKLTVSRDAGRSDENGGSGGDAESLTELFKAVSERGFDIHIDIKEHKAFMESMEAITTVRNAGFRKNNFILACEEELRKGSEDLSLEDMCMDNVYFEPPTEGDPEDEYGAIAGASSIEEILDRMTVDAAIALGMSDKLGSIERGKLADFTVFAENPFDAQVTGLFKKLTADMTILGGRVVYDVEEDNMQELYGLMSDMQV